MRRNCRTRRRCAQTAARTTPGPGPYESLESAAAREQPIPWIVGLSLGLTLFSGGVIAGLVTGIIARRRIKASNEQLGRLVFANIAIVLNVVSLAYFVFVIGPSLWRALMQ